MSNSINKALLDVLVHEVRSPVAALSAVAETAVQPHLDEATRRELVRLAVAACRGIERIVLDLAVASVRVEPLDAGTLARDVVATFGIRRANVVANIDAGQLTIDADPVRLRQALDNLITNALRHGASSKAVVVRVTRSGDDVEIAVIDSGPGIPAQEHARIFERGVRLDESTAGSGLGLTLSDAIVRAHGGALCVDSRPGEGSTFKLVLAARSPQPAT